MITLVAEPGASADSARTNEQLVQVAVIIVTYNPEPSTVDLQLSQLPAAATKVVVDNASQQEICANLRRLTAARGAVLVENGKNVGLAAAINQGVRFALRLLPACRFVLLLDQDTEPGEGGVDRLVAKYGSVAATAGTSCCIGPRLVDAVTGLDHGFHQIVGWRWARRCPGPQEREPVPLANLNGSGTLVPIGLFGELDGLEEDLFIDHVDTEWAFRVLAAGHQLYGIPDVTFRHRMGDHSLRFWFLRWRVWPYRSPARHYYLFRNAVRLMRRGYVPRVWKVWATLKLTLTLLVHLAFDSQRWPQARNMLRGVRDGIVWRESAARAS